MPVVPKLPLQSQTIICEEALELVKEIPVLLLKFKKQLYKLTIEAADPVTANAKSEFVCSCTPLNEVVPAAVKVAFPIILTLGVIPSTSLATILTPAFRVKFSV